MRKILLVGNFLSQHIGTTATSEMLAAKLQARGWDVITTSSFLQPVSRLVDMLLTTWLKRKNYDIAHVDVFSGRAFLWAEMVSGLLYLMKKPFILTFRSLSVLEFAQRWPKRVRRLIAKADKVMTPSRFMQQKLARFRDDIEYMPIGIDLANYTFKHRTSPSPRLCWLRAFHEMYNPSMAIDTVIYLRKNFPDIQLTMYGPDEKDGSFAQVQQLIEQECLENQIHIFGPVRKKVIPEKLQKHDVYLNTTNYESFGVAMMEAGAAGLPIVTTNVGELPFLWSDEEDALLVPANDALQMSAAISRILTEPGLAEKLSCNARAKAEQYDWKIILPEWEKLLNQTIEKSRNRKK